MAVHRAVAVDKGGAAGYQEVPMSRPFCERVRAGDVSAENARAPAFPDAFPGGQTVDHAHLHLIPRYAGDVSEPRGGIRWIIPARAPSWRV